MTAVPIPKERIPPDARSESQRREMVERFVAGQPAPATIERGAAGAS